MRPTAGRWVSDDDFFDREPELRVLESHVEALVDDVRGRVADAVEILAHDGYIEAVENGHRFPSRLLRDWWAARFRNHHTPLESRCPDPASRSRGR